MIYYLSGELIALLTFPGVILHEVAHRFFCDVQGVSVFAIDYFSAGSKVAGHVIHQPTDSLRKAFLIGIAPYIVNSVICMLLTVPYGVSFNLGTHFMLDEHSLLLWLQGIVAWVGFSAGFHAIPSNQDVKGLVDKAESNAAKIIITIMTVVFACGNAPYIGFWLKVGYAYLLSLIIPWAFL
jgi:hypothetical protein